MLFDIHNAPESTVVRCSGRIVQGDGADDLLRTVMAQESRQIQIDLSRVSAIDAGGLGALVALQAWARHTRRAIQLISPSRHVRKALETTGLTSVFQVRPSTRGEAA